MIGRTMLTAALLFLAGFCFGIDVRETKEKGTDCIRVDNSFYRIVILPGSGGRIVSWFDKIKNVEMVYGIMPENGKVAQNFNGMLDDRGGLSNLPYRRVIEKKSEDSFRIILSGTDPGSGLEVIKKLSFRENSPVVNVCYEYMNHSHKALSGFAVGIRNFVIPGGGEKVSGEDVYSIPTTHAVRKFHAYTFEEVNGCPMPELKTKLHTSVSAPWHAFIDTAKEQGIAVSLEDSFYEGWYAWKGKVEKPTYEWAYGDLQAGHRRETEFNIIQVDDMRGLVYASPELLADMKYDIKEKSCAIDTIIRPLEELNDCELKSELRQIGGNWKTSLPAMKIKLLAAEKNFTHKSEVKLPGEGLFEIRQTLSKEGKALAEWYDCISTGNVPFEQLFKMKYRSFSRSLPLPGWKGLEKENAVWDAASQERGFMLVNGEGRDDYNDLKLLSINTGKNEYESSSFLFYPASIMGTLSISVKNGECVNARIRVQEDKEINATSTGSGILTTMLLYDKLSFSGEKPVRIWITAGNGNLKPGSYELKIIVADRDGKKKELPVKVNVHDVPSPHRPLISLEAEGYPMSFPECGLAFGDKRNAAILEAWLKDMGTHGIDFFQEIGWLNNPGIYSYLKIAGTDQSLSKDIKKNPESYKKGTKLPDIDFSVMDFYFDRALANGLVRFKMTHYDISVPSPLIKHLYRQASSYLQSKGYQKKDLFVKILDEQPAEKFPAMAATAKWLKEDCRFRPFSTFHLLFGRPEELKILNPYFDMYQGGFTTREEYRKRLSEGLIDKDDVVLIYTGSGTMCKSYDEMASFGWNAAFMGHSMFHNHEYMRSGNNRRTANIVLIGEDKKPVDSPAFEGLRDGMECGNFVALYEEWKVLLKREKEYASIFEKLDSELENICGKKDSLLKIVRKESLGTECEKVAPATRETYAEAHLKVLEILDKLGKAAKSTGVKYAKAEWNNYVIYGNGAGFETVSANGKKEEKEAAEHFRKKFADASGISLKDIDSCKPAVKIVFDAVNTGDKMPYTYLISQENGTIRIKGKARRDLMSGAENLIKAMRVSGVWR